MTKRRRYFNTLFIFSPKFNQPFQRKKSQTLGTIPDQIENLIELSNQRYTQMTYSGTSFYFPYWVNWERTILFSPSQKGSQFFLFQKPKTCSSYYMVAFLKREKLHLRAKFETDKKSDQIFELNNTKTLIPTISELPWRINFAPMKELNWI